MKPKTNLTTSVDSKEKWYTVIYSTDKPVMDLLGLENRLKLCLDGGKVDDYAVFDKSIGELISQAKTETRREERERILKYELVK